MIDIRLPNITATDEAGQIAQMRSYLYQFAEQLQWALNTIEGGTGSEQIVLKNSAGEVVEMTDDKKAYDTFNSIKDLIIKSADVVEAYAEKIDSLLNLKGKYVAQSDFGTYKEETETKWSATPKYVEGKFVVTETSEGDTVEKEYDIDDLESKIRGQEGSIRVGTVTTTLEDDESTTGIEIGSFDQLDDVEEKRYATFSAAGVELYDGSKDSAPMVTISKSKITIRSAEFDEFVRLGKYRVDLNNGIAFKWVGGE